MASVLGNVRGERMLNEAVRSDAPDPPDPEAESQLPPLSFGSLLVFGIVVAPALTLLLAFGAGGLLALAEGWRFWVGFQYVISSLTGLGTPLTSASPATWFGMLCDLVISLWALGVVGTVLGCVANLAVTASIVQAVEADGGVAGAEAQGDADADETAPLRSTRPWLAFTLFVVLVVPAVVLLVAALFGTVLAAIEGWGVHMGFLYVVGNLAGLANPLVSLDPQSLSGQLVDVLFSLWSLALSGAALGVIGSLSLPASLAAAVDRAVQRARARAARAASALGKGSPG